MLSYLLRLDSMPIEHSPTRCSFLTLQHACLLLAEARSRCLQRHQVLIGLGDRRVDLARIAAVNDRLLKLPVKLGAIGAQRANLGFDLIDDQADSIGRFRGAAISQEAMHGQGI